MRYLENAFRFVFKNYMLGIPLLIIAIIPAIFQGIGSMFLMVNYTNRIKDILQGLNVGGFPQSGNIWDFYLNLFGMKYLIFAGVSLIVTIVLSIIFTPAEYGLINKKYQTGKAMLNDIAPSISKYIGRYILCGLLGFAIILGAAVEFGVLMFVAAFVVTASLPLGILLIILLVLAYIAGSITLYVYMSLWLPAVCTEDCGVIQGLTLSFKTVKGSFWMILGISLLIGLCNMAATGILSLVVGWIPVAGTVIVSAVGAFVSYLLIVFGFEVYRAKTGRFGVPLDGGNLSGVE
jgi:hypothetical protein